MEIRNNLVNDFFKVLKVVLQFRYLLKVNKLINFDIFISIVELQRSIVLFLAPYAFSLRHTGQ